MDITIPDGYTEEEVREMMERLADSDLESAEVARKIAELL